MKKLDRRTVLKGALGGAAIGVALPFLDVFLNNSGKALAATGLPTPYSYTRSAAQFTARGLS